MLRSYDSRIRRSNRSPEIYLAEECNEIVGENVKTVIELLEEGDSLLAPEDLSSNDQSKERKLLIIATPYRHGIHVAKTPKAFLPIIDQLKKLHEKGFLHGDIRAFNTVFGEHEDHGYLIDFDFGGKVGSTRYPEGYHQSLNDGRRAGYENEVIQKWEDWYALGQLIFTVHNMKLPQSGHSAELKSELLDTKEFWTTAIRTEPSKEQIKDLEDVLLAIDEQGWTVTPDVLFERELGLNESCVGTKKGASGSPLGKLP